MPREQPRMSRRALLAGSVGVAAGVAAVGMRSAAAEEQEKIKKTDALYQDHPRGQQRCEICLQFLPPDKCQLVEGTITAKGYCQFFAARENAH